MAYSQHFLPHIVMRYLEESLAGVDYSNNPQSPAFLVTAVCGCLKSLARYGKLSMIVGVDDRWTFPAHDHFSEGRAFVFMASGEKPLTIGVGDHSYQLLGIVLTQDYDRKQAMELTLAFMASDDSSLSLLRMRPDGWRLAEQITSGLPISVEQVFNELVAPWGEDILHMHLTWRADPVLDTLVTNTEVPPDLWVMICGYLLGDASG